MKDVQVALVEVGFGECIEHASHVDVEALCYYFIVETNAVDGVEVRIAVYAVDVVVSQAFADGCVGCVAAVEIEHSQVDFSSGP